MKVQGDPPARAVCLSKTKRERRSGFPVSSIKVRTSESLSSIWKANGSFVSDAEYLLAGLELLQPARLDSRDWLVKQLKAKHDGTPLPAALVGRDYGRLFHRPQP